jgi:uncharacterized protein (DUF488 family)
MAAAKKPKRPRKRSAVRRAPKSWPRGTVFTIGHSTRSVDELIELLKRAKVDLLVDVRSIPRSRTNPQFNTDALPAPLAAAGIGYRLIAALGGRRHHRKGDPPSPNGFWQNAAFRNYADYAMGPEFRSGLDELEALRKPHRCAIMCAEAVWWRCHRRIIADYLLTERVPVAHIMSPTKIEPAKRTPGARKRKSVLVYPEIIPS